MLSIKMLINPVRGEEPVRASRTMNMLKFFKSSSFETLHSSSSALRTNGPITTLFLKIVLCILLVFSHSLFAMVIGSDTVPYRETVYSTFPTGPVGNIIMGAAAMDVGFGLADSLTTVSFYSYFPVNAAMSLNNGSVQMAMDMPLTSSCDFPTTGTIYGNGYTISWAPHIGTLLIPSTPGLPGAVYFNNVNVVFNSFIQLQAPLYFTGNCILNGNGYAMNLGSAGSITIAPGSSLLIQNMTIKGLSGTNLVCLDSLGTCSLDLVTCQLSSNYTFSQGQLAIIGDTIMTGGFTFIYTSTMQSTIYSGATWYFDAGMTFSYAPANNAPNLINCQNSESLLYLYETSLYAPSTGLSLTKGTLTVQGNCPVYSYATTSTYGVTLGDGINSANDMSPNILPESGLQVMSGFLINNDI